MRGSGITVVARRSIVAALLLVPMIVAPPLVRDANAAGDPLPADLVLGVRGGGWGHGHGLSQYGARAQAEEGRTWREILRSYYSGVEIDDRGNRNMRVLLRSGRSVVVGGPEDYAATWASGGAARSRTDAAPYTRVRATLDGVAIAKAPSPTGPWDKVAAGSSDVLFDAPGGIVPVWMNERLEYYRGTVKALRRSSRTMYAINVLPMDQYLYGVVPREMPALWHMRALKAQAVAARSYSAWKRANVANSSTYDICTSTYCQVYRGYGYRTKPGSEMYELEHSRTNAAVDGTSGQTMVTADGPIFAEFHSSSGGYTGKGSRSYLAPRADPWDETYSPYHRWTTGLPVSKIESAWPALGRLVAIGPIERNGLGAWGGRVTSIRLVGTDGNVTVSGDTFRYSLGLRSTLYTIDLYDAAVAEDPAEVVVAPGATASATVRMTNTGNRPWPIGKLVRLKTSPVGRVSAFRAADWPSETRVTTVARDATDDAGRVEPGHVGELRFALTAPADATSGLYLETFRLHARRVTSFGEVVTVPVRVPFAGAAHLGANLVRNASFEAADEGGPAAWTGSGTRVARAVDGEAAVRQTGVPGSSRALRIPVAHRGDAGDRFAFSAWRRAGGTTTGGGTIDATVRFLDRDGTVGTERLLYPRSPHDWTYRESIVTAPASFRAIEVSLHLRDQPGTAWWDRVRLIRQELRNGSFERGGEDPRGWTISGPGGRRTARVRAGTAALRLAGRDGRAVRASQTLALDGAAGDVLCLGGWNRTEASRVSGGGVKLRAVVRHTDGTVGKLIVAYPRAAHDWRYGEGLLVAAKPFDSVAVHAVFDDQQGSAWFDDLALTSRAGARTLSANPGFELGAPLPGEWTLFNATAATAYIAGIAADGAASLRIDGSASVARSVRQSLPLAGEAGDTFVLSGWNRTTGSSPDGGAVRVRAIVRHLDGTSAAYSIEFARAEHDWRGRSLTFTTVKPYQRIDLFGGYVRQTGSAWFDDIRLEPA